MHFDGVVLSVSCFRAQRVGHVVDLNVRPRVLNLVIWFGVVFLFFYFFVLLV